MTFSSSYSGSYTAAASEPLPLSLETALESLQSEDFAHRWDAAKVIKRYGELAIAPLLNLLQEADDDDDLMWFIVRTLGEIAHPLALQALIQILQSTHADDIRQASATALAQHPEAVLPQLELLLKDKQGRSHAILVLVQMHHPNALPLLLSLANEADTAIRVLAVEALSYSHDPIVLPILKQALTDPIAAIRRAAVAGLSIWKDDQAPKDLVALIAPLLRDLNLEVCRQAILTLGRLGHEVAIVPLDEVLRSPYTPDSLRPDVIRSLSWIDHPAALDCLWRELSTTAAPAIAQEIIAILGRLTAAHLHPTANQILLEALQSHNAVLKTTEVRRAIAHSLGQLRQPNALQHLIHLLLDGDRSVQLHALAALRNWPTASLNEAIQYLRQQVQVSSSLETELNQLLAE
ncbi:HEAT repeat domain-containing protein [Leptolyngbya sp. FACHB-16]|uniref:HEAT repeat domain-containing protein n=1 Tax=unclassified Leptolyngbya TaxID=2650499 RepID=UPI0016882D9F|nr:HEAT repeat domain-containing protein [Leptolyngbya sp. FACHB-16]MBD2156200.1 HEAT repeat domain-containing protein [Leptolyngbya sp. FACHB-16]